MKRLFGTLMSIALIVAACGGGDTIDEPDSSTTAAPAPAGDDEPETTTTKPTSSEEPPASAGEEGTGSATIGATTWEFELDDRGTCDLDVNEAGAILVVIIYGTDEDGREIALNISGPPSGGEMMVQAGSATLEFERWTADSAVYSRLANIEGMPDGVGATAQVDGNTVSGSGLFYDDKALNDVRPTGDAYDAGVLEGTFTVTCPASG